MPRSSSSRRSPRARRPWWLALLILAAGWIYNTYLAEPPRREAPSRERATRSTRSTRSTPRTSTARRERDRSTPGGQLIDDVVVKVYDGDTVTLRDTGSVRLIGVDCPERAQQGGEAAGEFARRALLGQPVQVELCAKQPYDRYGRGLGLIYLVDRSGQRVLFNSELVRQGYARVYSLRPCTIDEARWNEYYEEARAARRGLFGQIGEVPDAAAYRRRARS